MEHALPGPVGRPPKGSIAPSDRLNDLGIDAICERLENGESLREIAKSLDMQNYTLRLWLDADIVRAARAKAARTVAAETADAQALAVLAAIPKDATKGEQTRAREIASHLRWRAKALSPDTYGDRLKVDASVSLDAAGTDALVAEVLSITASLAKPEAGK